MAGFDNNLGTTQPSTFVGGPNGVQLQQDPLMQAINMLSAAGVLIPARVGWAYGFNDAVSLGQLQSILKPSGAFADPTASLVQPL